MCINLKKAQMCPFVTLYNVAWVLMEILPLLQSSPSRLNCGLWFAFIAASNTFIVFGFLGVDLVPHQIDWILDKIL